MFTCADCARRACRTGETAGYPRDCPSPQLGEAESLARYRDETEERLAVNAARVEGHGYGRLTRVEETIDFARRCSFSHLGLAFCVGLHAEAKIVARILRANGFAVDSVACKNGSFPKEELGLSDEDKVRPGRFEAMCNPIGQAMALSRAGTELNIVLGLCVGHDSLFMMHSKAPVTVLAVKDRVLGHNPLAAVYLADGYYHDRLFPAGEGPAAEGPAGDTDPAV